MIQNVQLVVIGAGPAGMAAAVEAYKNGIENILILERDVEAGGILQQCIHSGFGLHMFNEELTGPEYAAKFIDEVANTKIRIMFNTMVLDISTNKVITAVNSKDGLLEIHAKAIVLAMGCRERTRGALNIPGSRPAGIFTAGAAQRFVNIEGYMPGKEVLILGSGDIGLIMARRMTLEGAKVKAVLELMPYSGGLMRNIVQCLDDFGIPLKLSHTVVQVHGQKRLEGVTIAKVGSDLKPISGTEEYIACDTLLLSVGLIPENELSKSAEVQLDDITSGPIVNQRMETSVSGIFACGNVVHVHDLVDNVTVESMLAGKCAAMYINGDISYLNDTQTVKTSDSFTRTKPGKGIRYIVPQIVEKFTSSIDKGIKFYFRVNDIYKNVNIAVKNNGRVLASVSKQKVTPGEMEEIKFALPAMEAIDFSSPIIFELEER